MYKERRLTKPVYVQHVYGYLTKTAGYKMWKTFSIFLLRSEDCWADLHKRWKHLESQNRMENKYLNTDRKLGLYQSVIRSIIAYAKETKPDISKIQ